MTPADKYLFDLNGYIIVRNVFSPEEIRTANRIIDKHASLLRERVDDSVKNTAKGSGLAGEEGKARSDMGGVLEWGEDSAIFQSVLSHTKLVPYYHTLVGQGYRLDHLPFVISATKGCEGHALHGGTIDVVTGEVTT